MDSQFALLKTRRFLPLFIVQFFGAFNDNLLKTVVVVLVAYGLWDVEGWSPSVLVAVASGLFILPFILFCPLAGSLSDKYDKAAIIRQVKLVEIFVAMAAVAVLFIGDIYLALLVLIALGAQSAFFSPCKFAILPQHLKSHELIGGNALVSTGTYLAILSGTILGAVIAPMQDGKFIASAVIMMVALIGYGAARFVPVASPPAPELKVSYNILARAVGVVRHAFVQPPGVVAGILGVAWFYFIAAAFHSQFPNFTKQTLGADNIVLTMFMVMFSLGIAVGGLLNHKVLKAQLHGALVPLACVFMALFGIDIYFAARAYPAPVDGVLLDFWQFVSNVHGMRLMADTFLLAVACGFFVIPLRAIVQARAAENVRSRVISSSNMMDAVFIFASSLLASILFSFGFEIEELYLVVSVFTLGLGFWLFKIVSLRANHQA